MAALQSSYDRHDRVVIVSDMQAFAHPGYGSSWAFRGSYRKLPVSEALPADVPMFGINTSGHAPASIDTGKPHRYEVGGFSDQVFTMVDLLSRGRTPDGRGSRLPESVECPVASWQRGAFADE